MRATWVAVLAACLLIAAPLARAAEPDVDEKDVFVLTEKNAKETLAKHKFALVEFYAPWCGHCKSLKPEWAKAATALKAHDPSILIAKVDATEEKELGSKYEVKGYPTIKWFVDGELAMDYSGGRTSPDIVNWVKKKTGPATTLAETAAALDKATKDAEVSLVGYFAKPEGDDFKAFEALAQKTDDATFIVVTDAALAKSLGIKSAPGFAVGRSYPGFDFEAVSGEGHAAMAGDAPLEERLTKLLTAEKLPAFLEFSPATSSRIFNSGVDKQVIVVAPEEAFAAGAALRKALEAASAKTRGQVVWVTSKLGESTGEPIVNFFGMSADAKEPQVVGFFATEGKKYAYPEGDKVDAEGLLKFAAGVVDGTAPRRTKSADVPAEPLDEGVTVVVGSTFDAIVKDPTKDVLLEVYAPWCGHCKSLAPIYSKLAKRFANVDSVVIAKMDGTENEHPDAEASGYPTLLFFPADKDAEAVKYEGARELKDMTKFIKANAKVAFELPKKADKAAAKEEEKKEAEDADEGSHDEL